MRRITQGVPARRSAAVFGLGIALSAVGAAARADVSFGSFITTDGVNLAGSAQAQDGVVRLTPARDHQAGSLWAHDKQDVSRGWTTTFQFRITARGGGVNTDGQTGGDGFIFLLQNTGAHHVEDTLMGVGGGLGYNGMSNVLAFEFDTWMNRRANDPNGNHLSIVTAGRGQTVSTEDNSIGRATNIPNMSDGQVHTARIEYAPGEVRMFLDDLSAPAVTAPLDLAQALDLDQGAAWVGFTGATGGAWQNQDILNWSFSVIPTPGPLALGGLSVIALGARRRAR